jgi:hypothetical protein
VISSLLNCLLEENSFNARCFFTIDLSARKVEVPGVLPQTNGPWMEQIARNITWEDSILSDKKCLIHDRYPLFTAKFGSILKSSGVEPFKLPPRSPNLNAFAERLMDNKRNNISFFTIPTVFSISLFAKGSK